MVKGITRQVIVVSSPDGKLFEQAIFILSDKTKGVTEEMLLREAKRLSGRRSARRHADTAGRLICTLVGAGAVTLIWILCHFL